MKHQRLPGLDPGISPVMAFRLTPSGVMCKMDAASLRPMVWIVIVFVLLSCWEILGNKKPELVFTNRALKDF